jgi:hypothetical protein
MTAPSHQVFPNHDRAIWVLYDLRDPKQCQHLHEQRASWQELSDLAALGSNHMILLLSPGGAASGSAITKEAQRG